MEPAAAGTAAAAARRQHHSSLLSPALYGLAVLGLRIALLVTALAAGYLLFGLLSGQLGNFTNLGSKAEQDRVLGNVALAGNVLVAAVAAAAFLTACAFAAEEAAGYLLVAVGLFLYVGIPFGYAQLVDTSAFGGNRALQNALVAFPRAAWAPLGLGALLVVRDLVLRLAGLLQNRPLEQGSLRYGPHAQAERSKPVRLAILGKCWEGPFCREFVRVHCPIFHARKACWRVRRGCYCEEDIVSNAAAKVSGVQLTMAPDVRYNFANDPNPSASRKPQLSMAQKKERCRNCVIYNQHQREKYQLLMPLVMLAVIGLCLLGSEGMRAGLGAGLAGLESVMQRLSFGDARSFSFRLVRPSPLVEWIFIGAFIVMILSKALEALEWAIFKIKI